MPLHEFFSKDLASLELGRGRAGSNDLEALFFKAVCNPQSQWQLRPYYGEVNFSLLDELNQFVDPTDPHGGAPCLQGRAAIAGLTIYRCYLFGLTNLPDQGVFTPAGSHDQDFHNCPLLDSLWIKDCHQGQRGKGKAN